MGRRAAVLTFVAALVLAGTASAAQTFGISDGQWREPQIANSFFLTQLGEVNAKAFRISVNWQYYETTGNDVFNNAYFGPPPQSNTDALYSALLARGIKPIITLLGTPPWAVAPGYTCPASGECYAPPDLANPAVRGSWEDWARTVATRYPQAAVEVWNEPNIGRFFGNAPNSAIYSNMLSTASAAISGIPGQNTQVVTGGLSNYGTLPGQTGSPTQVPFQAFLRDIYDRVSRTAFDAVSYHSYPCGPAGTSRVRTDTQAVRDVINEKGDAGKRARYSRGAIRLDCLDKAAWVWSVHLRRQAGVEPCCLRVRERAWMLSRRGV